MSEKLKNKGFGLSDQLHTSIPFQQKFRGFEPTVIIISHGIATRSHIVNKQILSLVNLRQF